MRTAASDKLKVGMILPSLQVVTEPLYYQIAGKEFEFFTTRLYLGGADIKSYMEMERSLPRAVCELETAQVDIMAYCCTASGALRGYEEEQAQCREFERGTKIPMVTTMTSVVDALRYVSAQRIVLVSPYDESINQAEIVFFDKNGFEVLKDAGQGIHDGSEMSKVTPDQIIEFTLNHWDDRADALFMSCMNWHAMRSVEVIEAHIHKPVITSHSATLWKIMSLMHRRLPIPQYGKWLFS